MVHPSIRELFLNLNRHPVFQDVVQRLHTPGTLRLSGLTTTAKALYTVLLWQVTERPILIVVDGNKQSESLFEAIDSFFQLLVPPSRDRCGPQLLPALDVVPGQAMSPHAEILQSRTTTLWRLAQHQSPITVTPVASALLRIERPQHYRQLAQTLKVGDEIPIEDLTAHLESVGYEKREPVEMVGEYSVRGGILDVFSPEAEKPVRVELFGDEIDSIRQFEVESQRSVLKINSCTLLPLTPYQRSRRALAEVTAKLRDAGMPARELPIEGETFPGWELMLPLIHKPEATLFDFFERPILMWDEPELSRSAAERHWKRLLVPDRPTWCPPELVFQDWEEMRRGLQSESQIEIRELDISVDPTLRFHIPTRAAMAFHGNMQVAIAEARTLVEAGNRVVFFGGTTGEVERVADIMHEYGVVYQLGLDQNESTPEYLAGRAYMGGSAASVFLVKGRIARGTVFPDAKLVAIGSEDLFDASDMVARPSGPKISTGAFSADQFDLKPGDYVVHAEHGVGQFVGLKEIAQGEAKGDYMLLEYAGGSKLYVPLTRMDLIQRFRGAGEAAPRLDSMGGSTWNRTKSKVKAKMRDMAEELLKLYAQRKMAKGFSFSSDSNWQREFDDAFEFTETKDQKAAINDIKRDMESDQPMDRLLCGDVGYGKTEVVMRAAFKALGDGKQVSVLAPTTVLAFQHYETFKRRFQSFPVRIEMLSRFRTPKELKAAIEDIGAGKVDIAIGTHRLFSKDVEFKDLGLVIVDEEQRFGVKHKERLKQLKHSVDVITMSATPIPRTLHMSMLGLRDMSVIETPPKDRLAIQTVVAPFQSDLVRSAIELELGRGGQVYFVHNRIDSIFSRAAQIQGLVPNARIGVGHGQMGEAELEKTMLSFMRHEFDVLVSTTIVENGLDIPLANTIIIENAEKQGLSELYQLRGRVGRSNRRAYAYLLVPEDTELTEIARKRLAALKEFSDLGAGFKIAALDLELRGAGNLLGGEQHGHINSVGFDMYVRMLDETVRELKGEEIPPEIRSVINLGLDIRIPPDYIGDENQRLKAYKRIATAATAEEREKVEKELDDRYGPPPEEVRNLLTYSALKTAAESLGVENIERKATAVQLKFSPEARVDAMKLAELVSKTQGAQFTPAGVLRVPLDRLDGAGAVLAFVKDEVLRRLA
ncbi:MAG TPA: transcription-repair coupling factor [Bryobacteraceae bacterium]